jgi:serine phosphatase RsbU (regulator of sigma subunit)
VADNFPLFGRELRLGAPDQLADIADRYVRQQIKAIRVEMLLADYRIDGLWPVLDADHDVAGSLGDPTVAARVFASQRPLIEELPDGSAVRAIVPISAWSDRLGVLTVDLPARPDQQDLAVLSGVADELAIALSAADRNTDHYRRARRTQRLTMAAEMQWDLLPGRALGGPTFELAAQLEPAYEVSGDHFDWALNGSKLTVTTLNGDGRGLGATLLTVLAVNGMRNARRSGGSLVEQAELASDALFSEHGGKRCVATLLLEVDVDTGEVAVIDAGSPIALRMRGSELTRFELEKQMPLGTTADSRYSLQHFTLEPGDRLVVASDGVHNATPGRRAPYGDNGMTRAIRAARMQPAGEAVGAIMRALQAYHGADAIEDDAVLVCLDWNGDLSSRRR